MVMPSQDLNSEVLQRTLDLRKRRLKREGEELRFLQMDSQTADGEASDHQFVQYIMLTMQARQLIEAEMQRLGHGLV
jgi:hypothetical protein